MRHMHARIPVSAVLAVALSAGLASAAVRDFAYLSPLPGSRMVSPENNVALRLGTTLDASSVSAGLVSVSGSRSGAHAGQLRLSGDGLTLIFKPHEPFATNETVRVRLLSGLRTRAGSALPPLDYTFQVSSVYAREMPQREPERMPDPPEPSALWNDLSPSAVATVGPCDTLLPGFPSISLINASDQLPGAYFMAPFNGNTTPAQLQILDDRGKPLYQRTYANKFMSTDFKPQPGGRLTFFMNAPLVPDRKYFAMDSAYAVVDSFACGNGYPTDQHELKILPNGHALMMSYDPQRVDMSLVVPGGNPNAIVIGLIVQELDENKDVVFQWRSWDWFQITDASVSPLVNLTAANIDYVHGNSIDLCPDGNLIVSCRHMCEITKISRTTGEVLWRMGRNAVKNQFQFPNDTRGFSHQHDARMLPNGHLTVFDNGNGLSPQYSRALEFELDEENLVANKVWEYRHTPDIYGSFMGDVQRHADGSTTIGWGGPTTAIKSTDLHADGSIAAELSFPVNQVNYRTFRAPWRTNRMRTSVEDIDVASPAVGQSEGRALKVWNNWGQPIDITCLRTADTDFGATLESGSLPVHLAPGESTTVQVVYNPSTLLPEDSRLYVMQVSDNEIVAQTVDLHGHIDETLGVPPASGLALTATARPNPLRLRTTIDYAVPTTGPVKLALFDVHGRKVATLVDGVMPAGRHSVEWSAPRGRGGLYFYRLQASGRTLVEKLIVTGQ